MPGHHRQTHFHTFCSWLVVSFAAAITLCARCIGVCVRVCTRSLVQFSVRSITASWYTDAHIPQIQPSQLRREMSGAAKCRNGRQCVRAFTPPNWIGTRTRGPTDRVTNHMIHACAKTHSSSSSLAGAGCVRAKRGHTRHPLPCLASYTFRTFSLSLSVARCACVCACECRTCTRSMMHTSARALHTRHCYEIDASTKSPRAHLCEFVFIRE